MLLWWWRKWWTFGDTPFPRMDYARNLLPAQPLLIPSQYWATIVVAYRNMIDLYVVAYPLVQYDMFSWIGYIYSPKSGKIPEYAYTDSNPLHNHVGFPTYA